jgi:TPR repeat protein
MYSIRTELKLSLERQKNNLVRIIPVIGRPCFWKSFSDLSSFQVLPKDGKPIEIDGRIKELRLVDAAEGIIQAVKEVAATKLEPAVDAPRSYETLDPASVAQFKAAEGSPSGADNTSAKAESSRRFRFWLITSAALFVTFAVIWGISWNSRTAVKGASLSEPVAELLETGKDLYKQRNYSASLPYLLQAGKKGSGEADDYLGLLYRDGKGVPRNYKEAEKWFLRAASRRNSDGMNHLGLLHESGSGIPLSYENALAWFRKAEALGNGDAMNNLGWMFLSGWGVPKDPNKALEYFQRSAAHSCGDGMNNLGWLYQEGIAVPKQDYEQAFKWFKKGADRDSALAMNSIGWMLLNGLGRQKDQRRAIQWFEKAANRDEYLGSGMAMNNLGWAYENGLGVAPDKTKAISWYRKASQMGNHLGKLNLARLGAPECADPQKLCGVLGRDSLFSRRAFALAFAFSRLR